jgi:predicted  nucleic acid-binding Zn-ribbon protein
MKQTEALYHLQTLDSQLDAVQKRLAEITTLLNENTAVRTAQAALEQAESALRHWQTRLTDLELERTQLQQEAAATEDRLYSGRVTNPRELLDMQNKLAELRHRHTELEEPLLEAMVSLEESQTAVKQAQETLERVKQEQASTVGALSAEQAKLNTKLQDLQAQVAQARTAVQPASLSLYDRLRQRTGGLAVSVMEDESCGSCGVEISSQLAQQVRHGEVILCPTCGRILYTP